MGKDKEKKKTRDELTLHQAMAVLDFLETNGFKKAAKKLKKQLKKDYDDIKLPKKLSGKFEWKEFVKESDDDETVSSGEYEADDNAAEDSESDDDCTTASEVIGDEEQQKDKLVELVEIESSDDEDHVNKGSDDDEKKQKRRARRKAEKAGDGADDEVVKGPPRRSVSFSDDEDVRLISPKKTGDEKRKLYWSKLDLERMKIERENEKMAELMSATASNFGINSLPSFFDRKTR